MTKTVAFCWGFFVCFIIMFIAAVLIRNTWYRQGQIQALRGNIEYRAIVDTTTVIDTTWVKIRP